ncbi:MAG: hypothetical protein JW836_10550 [Deltaproteobacteria bacterium]|nr:hypothetical protein [Deltaproteobacteria bacterium]
MEIFISLNQRGLYMATKYRVLFIGLVGTEEQFKRSMCSRFGVPSRTVEQIIEGAPIVLKKDLHLGEARKYAEALQMAGGKVHIQECGESKEPQRGLTSVEIKSFGDFTVCPECGFTQLKAETCVKCGFLFLPKNRVESGT